MPGERLLIVEDDDLVLLDLGLPDLDGLVIAGRARR
jgi:DNA-binding response OmpR family regulator